MITQDSLSHPQLALFNIPTVRVPKHPPPLVPIQLVLFLTPKPEASMCSMLKPQEFFFSCIL